MTRMNNNIIFLCGLKNCGKTYFAQKLSEKTKILWLDSDQEILKLNKEYSSCRELYKQVGPSVFRDKEKEAIESIIKTLTKENKVAIVSLGGGVCEANNSLEIINEHGILVYLQGLEHVLYKRMQDEGLPPYLGDNPQFNFHELYIKRDKVYSCFANYVIELYKWSEEQVLNKLKELLQI